MGAAKLRSLSCRQWWLGRFAPSVDLGSAWCMLWSGTRSCLPSALRCLAFGHQVRDCNGANRTGKFWSCGEDEHFGHDCSASPDKVATFK